MGFLRGVALKNYVNISIKIVWLLKRNIKTVSSLGCKKKVLVVKKRKQVYNGTYMQVFLEGN